MPGNQTCSCTRIKWPSWRGSNRQSATLSTPLCQEYLDPGPSAAHLKNRRTGGDSHGAIGVLLSRRANDRVVVIAHEPFVGLGVGPDRQDTRRVGRLLVPATNLADEPILAPQDRPPLLGP